jgi:hypothetical protein
MANWSKQEIDDEAKSASNEKLLEECIEAACGDSYDGCFTARGKYRAKVLYDELKRRLAPWISAQNLSACAGDELVGKLRDKYTMCKPCGADVAPDAHTVWLKVGVQSFCVTVLPCETKKSAEWMREMLAKALATVVAESAKNP